MTAQPVRESIKEFLREDPQGSFFIPIYQKNYMWKPEEETARFMNDAEGILRKPHRHFLGLIIYRKVSRGLTSQYEIVDGQQRLTTIYLYLLTVYEEARHRKNIELARSIMKDYLSGSNTLGLRFMPSAGMQGIYYKLVSQAMDIVTWSERQGIFYQNYQYIAQYVHVLAERYGVENLVSVLDAFEIIAFPLESDDDVQQIFESINLAGSCMTFTDRIRDYVFMNHSEEEQNMLYRMYWQPFEKIFPDADSMMSFIRSYLAVKTGSMLDRSKVYAGFKDYWSRINDASGRKLSDLYGYTLCYQMVYEGPADDPQVEEALQDFRIAGYKEPAVLLMEIMHRFRLGECTAEETAKMIRLLDTYLTRRAIGGTENKNLIGWFPSVLRNLRAHFNKPEGELYSTLRDLLLTSSRSDFPHGMPSDRQIRNIIRTSNIYANTRITRVLLERLEKSSSTVKVDMSGLNIEHIMPVHPTQYWRSVSRCQDDGEYSMIANLLGNLTLADASDNMEMGNDSFDAKKKVLAETGHIHLNADVLKEPVWNKKTILNRCDAMADALLKIYPYPVKQNETEKKPEQTSEKPAEVKETAPAEAQQTVYIMDENAPLANGTYRYYAKGPGLVSVYRSSGGNGAVLLPGSIIKAYGDSSMKSNRILYEQFKTAGAIKERNDGTAVIEKKIFFSDLSSAGGFVLQRGGDNSGIWQRHKPHVLEKQEQNRKEEKPAETPVITVNPDLPLPEEPLAPVAEESEAGYPEVEEKKAELSSAEQKEQESAVTAEASEEKPEEKAEASAAAEERMEDKVSAAEEQTEKTAEQSVSAAEASEEKPEEKAEEPVSVTAEKPAEKAEEPAVTEELKEEKTEETASVTEEKTEEKAEEPAAAAEPAEKPEDESTEKEPEGQMQIEQASPSQAEPSEEKPAEEKPVKKKRTVRKKKTESAEAKEVKEAEDKKPKKRTTRKKKTEESTEAAEEEKPKRRSRKKKEEPAEETAEAAEGVTEIDKALQESEDMEEKEKKTKKTGKSASKTVKKADQKDTEEKKAAPKKRKTAAGKKTEKKSTAAEGKKKTAAGTAKKTAGKSSGTKKTASAGRTGTKSKNSAARVNRGTAARKPAAKKAGAKQSERKTAPYRKAADKKTLNKRRNNRPGLRMKPQSSQSRSAKQHVNIVTFAGQSR